MVVNRKTALNRIAEGQILYVEGNTAVFPDGEAITAATEVYILEAGIVLADVAHCPTKYLPVHTMRQAEIEG